jgi:hypothetical protein
MADTRSLEDLRQAGAGRPAPEAVARLYHTAFDKYGVAMLWSRKRLAHPTITQALGVSEALRHEGNMQSRPLAIAIEDACRAAV